MGLSRSHTALILPFVVICSLQSYSQATPSLLTEIGGAFAGSQVVQQVQITGNATAYINGKEDSGSITLAASANGSSQIQLNLASGGQRTEAISGIGSNSECTWTGSDGVAHPLSSENCWKPLLWFLPGFSLQPTLVPSYLTVADGGIDTTGDLGNGYRQLQSNLIFNNLPQTLARRIASESISDLWLDPATFLPAALTYSVHPDSGASAQVLMEIHYSDYRKVKGVQIPFHIQRYVNGALQLDILVSSVQAN